jgi:predicted transcriptional regulator of viral defense system
MGVGTHHSELPRGRLRLAKVASRARPFIDIETAAAALQWDARRAAKQLARWHQQGLLRRIRRGVYAVLSPSGALREQVVADPWLIVPTLFRQAYVAGWTAAEHWDLTEQVFKTLLVCTPDRIKHTNLRVAGIDIRARHIPLSLWVGTAATWHDGTRVLVSDVHKTVVDMCFDPALGGGIQHVAQCLSAYFRRDDADPKRLLRYASETATTSALKRLGFLCEVLGGPTELRDACLREVTIGLAKLDPVMPSPRVSKRWQLRLPNAWKGMFVDG